MPRGEGKYAKSRNKTKDGKNKSWIGFDNGKVVTKYADGYEKGEGGAVKTKAKKPAATSSKSKPKAAPKKSSAPKTSAKPPSKTAAKTKPKVRSKYTPTGAAKAMQGGTKKKVPASKKPVSRTDSPRKKNSKVKGVQTARGAQAVRGVNPMKKKK